MATDLRIKKSTRALLDASFPILLHNPHASLSEIATYAGVGRATLYRHYPTRDALIKALALESLQIIDDALVPIGEAKLAGVPALKAMVEALLPLAERYHFLQMIWNVAELDLQVWQLYEQQMALISGWVEQGQLQGNIDPELSVMWIVAALDGLLYSASWLIASNKMTVDQLQWQFIKLLCNGLHLT